MSGPMWLRFLDAGNELATSAPDLFPTVVILMESLLTGHTPPRPPSAHTLADVLVLAEPALADVAHLEALLAPLASDERLVAEQWARVKIAARGQDVPSMPACIAALFQRLPAAPEAQ